MLLKTTDARTQPLTARRCDNEFDNQAVFDASIVIYLQYAWGRLGDQHSSNPIK